MQITCSQLQLYDNCNQVKNKINRYNDSDNKTSRKTHDQYTKNTLSNIKTKIL